MDADLVILGGKIVTMDPRESIAEALAVKFGRVLAVGSSDDMGSLVGDGTEVMDLKGATVVPGLIDSHCHMATAGVTRMLVEDLSEEAGIRSIADIQSKLRTRAARTPRGNGSPVTRRMIPSWRKSAIPPGGSLTKPRETIPS